MRSLAALAIAGLLATGCGGGSSASGTWTAKQESTFRAQLRSDGHTAGFADCALTAAEKKWPNHFDYTSADPTEVVLRLSDACD